MTASADDLKLVMRHWASGVAVLTCREGAQWQGMTVSSFTSVSADPPIVTISLANATRAKAIVEATGFFAINILSEVDQELADRFAGRSGDQEDRFRGVKVNIGPEDLPLLRSAIAWLVCRVEHAYPFKESTLLVGEVFSCASKQDTAPLVYFNRNYHRLK